MGKDRVQIFACNKNEVSFSSSGISLNWSPKPTRACPGPLFASVSSQVGAGFGVTPNPNPNDSNGSGVKFQLSELLVKNVPSAPEGLRHVEVKDSGGVFMVEEEEEEEEEDGLKKKGKKKNGMQFKAKIANASLRRLVSGAVAGAFSRTAVAPLETIRTHLMVGSSGNSSSEVFNDIMKNEGWKGLFRGNFVNVIRVAPSKAIEVYYLPSAG